MENAHNLTSDAISFLPRSVIETILMYLPLRDATRTSVLSSQWRYNWVRIPQLVFDDKSWPSVPLKNRQTARSKLMISIYEVLLFHCGPILKFTLSISWLKSCPEIDRVILHLSTKGVQEFTLHIWKGDCHKLPSSLFSCLELTHLNLRSCVFVPPPTFKGFCRLISVELYEVILAADVLESLISSCPQLEELTFESSHSFDYLRINAPNLKLLVLRGRFKSICFNKSPFLAKVSISLKAPVEGLFFEETETSNSMDFFSCLPVIENLHICRNFLKCLVADSMPTKLPTLLMHLKILELSDIWFGKVDEVLSTLSLIRSSPNLQKVTITLLPSTVAAAVPVAEFLGLQDYSDVNLKQLREVNMQPVSGTHTELEFIKLLLAKSPVLDSLLIKPNLGIDTIDRLKMLRELTRFRRASPNAEIIYNA